jgi:FAD/FMN-containing dehydrogenase
VVTRRSFLQAGIGTAAAAVATDIAFAGNAFGTITTPWHNLRKHLSGQLVLPGGADYKVAREVAFAQFDGRRPQAVAYCVTSRDVQTCVLFAQHHDVAVTARSGGHSYAGYSTGNGLVIDVSRMKSVSADGSAVTVGAGATSVDILTALAPLGLALPAGLYPTVGIAGYLQGGGIGWDTRPKGLACDRLTAAEVVLADGRLVRCDSASNPDLYWALRGGGGGNFGVVTRFRSRAFPADPMVAYSLSWPWAAAADIMSAWQAWIIGGPHQLSSSFAIISGGSGAGAVPLISLTGTYLGSTDAAQAQLSKLIDAVGQQPTINTATQLSRLDAMLQQYGCAQLTLDECQRTGTTPMGEIQPTGYTYDRGRLFNKAMPSAGVQAILGTFEQDQPAGQTRVIWLLAMGGQANDKAPEDTAWVHRSAQFVFSVYTSLPDAAPDKTAITAAQEWTNQGFAIIDPYSSGHSYQNFIDPNLPAWRNAYYGRNYRRLSQVKNAYDPHRFFRFAQSIG